MKLLDRNNRGFEYCISSFTSNFYFQCLKLKLDNQMLKTNKQTKKTVGCLNDITIKFTSEN